MKHSIFSVFDEKAMAYLPPFVMHREEMAMRVFSDCVNDSDHAFGKHPSDYTLFCLGGFDDGTGVITGGKARTLGNGLIFLRHVVENVVLEDVSNA
jgi:hypothetical protein